MSFKTQMATDATAVFFNTAEFADSVVYVKESGEEICTDGIKTQIDMADAGGFGAQASLMATWHLKRSDAPDPQPAELIYSGTDKWRIVDVMSGDEHVISVRCELLSRVRG